MSQNLLRVRDGQGASVSFSELLFDLIYVFAVTQLSHCASYWSPRGCPGR